MLDCLKTRGAELNATAIRQRTRVAERAVG